MLTNENYILKLDGKTIGTINDGGLYMKRNTVKHFYRVLDAWCLNIEVINCGADKFVIDTEKKERYIITLATIKALRSQANLFVTFGQERQLAIPAQCWDKYSHENLSFPVFIGTPPTEFTNICTGRWRSRLLAFGQLEIAVS
jgi:hypothetical protein